MRNHRIRGSKQIKEIVLKNPSLKKISINFSIDIMSQINKILQMKEHIDSFANKSVTLNQIPKDTKIDNIPDVVDICDNSQSKNSENDNNSNNELLKYGKNVDIIDLTGDFNMYNKTTETNQIDASSFLSTIFEQNESDIKYFNDDDIILTEDDLLWSMETEIHK